MKSTKMFFASVALCSAFTSLTLPTETNAQCVFGIGSCGPGISDAELYIREKVGKNSDGRLKLISLKMIDGREVILDAAKIYELEYEADIEVVQDAYWSLTSPMLFATNPGNNPGFMRGNRHLARNNKGDRIKWPATIAFEKFERGWRILKIPTYEGMKF